mmetsp:Transcript_30355/g.56156  ORF Transcript_30355/g.56156 Transcript_30355/m.56156 type:complete len:477 (-) Transcript_30355:26-1456(-)
MWRYCGLRPDGRGNLRRAGALANRDVEARGLQTFGHNWHWISGRSAAKLIVLACIVKHGSALDYTAVENKGPVTQEAMRQAEAAKRQDRPKGPSGDAAAHVFTFADRLTAMLCHLARTVEAAGAWLHILGLRHGEEADIPWGEVDPLGSTTREGEAWHFADKAIMLKKHLFLSRAIRELPPNVTVIFVDGFDVLFQRPLKDMVAAYREVAGPHAAKAGGAWPVLFGGEKNCWPFPHNGRLPVTDVGPDGRVEQHIHRVPDDSFLSAEHHGTWRYAYGDKSPWSIGAKAVCSEWLSSTQYNETFPFLCAGTFMGTAAALRRLLRRLFSLFKESREYHDQALLALLVLRNRSLGLVDTTGKVFLGLHGHDQFKDLERPLCQGNYFVQRPGQVLAKKLVHAPVRDYQQVRGFEAFQPPRLRGEISEIAPSVLHFNGNGKRHMQRCVEEFRKEGLLGGWGDAHAECTFYDWDRDAWVHLR